MNLLLFQINWWVYFLCAYTENFLGALFNFLIYSALHFFLISENRLRDLKIMLGFGLAGYFLDFFVFENLLFSMKHKTFEATFWLFGMWWGFMSCVPYSLRKLIQKPIWAFVMAALFGPLSYWAGEKVGVLSYYQPIELYYGIHGLFWAFFFWALSYLEKRKLI